MASKYDKHYSYWIEFQIRGLPHLHGVFWLEESYIEKFNKNGEFDDEEVPNLINDWISCSLDTGDSKLNKIVREVNVHKHTKSCRRSNKICRFNFPRMPSDRTLIAKPLDEENLGKNKCAEMRLKAKNILDKVKNHIAEMKDDDLETKSLDAILSSESVGINSEDYHWALSISTRGDMVILKRKPNEIWVNNYNQHFMKAWEANMDIQFCLDSYAVIHTLVTT